MAITTSAVGFTVRCDLFLAVGCTVQCGLFLVVILFCLVLLLTAGKEKGAERGEILLIVWGFNSILNE